MRDYIALAAKIYAVPFKKKTRHFWGLGPLTPDEPDMRVEMKRPAFLMIESGSEGGAHLNRYTSTGEFVGDTWGFDIDYVKQQAEEEFGGYFSEWHEIPQDVDDPISYIVKNLDSFDDTYRVKLEAKGMPSAIGPGAAADVSSGFMSRPWNRNVKCAWNPDSQTLTLQADNPYDRNGTSLKEEFFDEIYACTETIRLENIHVISIEKLKPLQG